MKLVGTAAQVRLQPMRLRADLIGPDALEVVVVAIQNPIADLVAPEVPVKSVAVEVVVDVGDADVALGAPRRRRRRKVGVANLPSFFRIAMGGRIR